MCSMHLFPLHLFQVLHRSMKQRTPLVELGDGGMASPVERVAREKTKCDGSRGDIRGGEDM